MTSGHTPIGRRTDADARVRGRRAADGDEGDGVSAELRDDLTMRDLLDRCIKAEIEAKFQRARAKSLAQGVRAALRAKSLEKVHEILNTANESDMTLIVAMP